MEADGINCLAGMGLEESLCKEGRDPFCLLWSGRQRCPESLRVHLAASICKAAEHSDVGRSVQFHETGSGPWNPNGSSQRPGLECDSEQFPRAGFHACIHLTNIY